MATIRVSSMKSSRWSWKNLTQTTIRTSTCLRKGGSSGPFYFETVQQRAEKTMSGKETLYTIRFFACKQLKLTLKKYRQNNNNKDWRKILISSPQEGQEKSSSKNFSQDLTDERSMTQLRPLLWVFPLLTELPGESRMGLTQVMRLPLLG